MAESRSEPHNDSVDHVLAEYLRRVDRGEAVDRERFIAEHPEVADQLRAYFAGSDAVRGVADGTGGLAPKPSAPTWTTPPAAAPGPVTEARSQSGNDTTGYPAKPAAEGMATRGVASTGGPMGVAQVAAFLSTSGLMTPAAVDALVRRAHREASSADAGQLLDALQNSGRLTLFQCQAIREGRMAELILGNYVVLDRLGRGGMGQVFRAWHRKMDRVVALKTLRPETMNSDKAVRRFHREVKAAARLAHPNIVTAHDADESGGVHFLVMEHVAGSDLAAHVREHGPASVAQAANWVLQAARGLAHAHQHGIVHRDIKPSNLLLAADGVVKVLDMGLARLVERMVEDGAAEGLTQAGDMLGTLDYMAPEQAEDTAHADAPADMYSLGCTLFYLLTGRAVYGGDTAVKKLMAHCVAPVPSLASIRRDVPEPVDALFQRMIAKNPADRPSTMQEVIAELEPFTTAAGTAADGTQTYRAPVQQPTAAATDRTQTHHGRSPKTVVAAPDHAWTYLGPLSATTSAAASRSGRRRRVFVAIGGVALAAVLALVAGTSVSWMPILKSAFEFMESRGAGKATDTRGWAGWPERAPAPAVAPFDVATARRHREAWARYLGQPLQKTNRLGMEFVLVPPGEFDMGSPQEEVEQLRLKARQQEAPAWISRTLSAETPRHRVRITRPFYLAKFPVTQQQWEAVMGNNPSHFKNPRNPVENVSWSNCQEFLRRLNETAADSGQKFRLPTEAEWEYACRAGTATSYSFGHDVGQLGKYAWYAENANSQPRPVGQKQSNAWGLYDMHGNVWEWCADWYGEDHYANSPTDDPKGPADGAIRMHRGGCWFGADWYCRSAARMKNWPHYRSNNLGLRIVLVPADEVLSDMDCSEEKVVHPPKRPTAQEERRPPLPSDFGRTARF